MEGHLGPATSTSPTRTEIHEFSDRAYFDAMTQEEEAQEMMEENENEYYTQSFNYISEEEAGERWQEAGEEEQPTGEGNLVGKRRRGKGTKEEARADPGRVRRGEKGTFGEGTSIDRREGSQKTGTGTRAEDAPRQKPRLEVLHRRRQHLETKLSNRRKDMVDI